MMEGEETNNSTARRRKINKPKGLYGVDVAFETSPPRSVKRISLQNIATLKRTGHFRN